MKYFLNIFFLIILNLFCSEVVSQKITIVDSTSGRPIRAVLVFDSEKINRTVSNRSGTVYLNSFKDSDSIIFAHIIYQRKALPCLLYTSPSPRDRTRSRMPSSA